MRASARSSRQAISSSRSGAASTATMRPSSRLQAVAGGEDRGLGEVEQEAEAAGSGQRDAAPGAVVVVEAHDVGGLRVPEAGAEDFGGSQHCAGRASQVGGNHRRRSVWLPLTPALSPRYWCAW